MMSVAVNISCFRDSRFPVIYYVLETEDFVGFRNFTALLDFDAAYSFCPRCLFCITIKRLAI